MRGVALAGLIEILEQQTLHYTELSPDRFKDFWR